MGAGQTHVRQAGGEHGHGQTDVPDAAEHDNHAGADGKTRTTNDPTERQKLMQEHMQSMQENMKTMRNMGGPMMIGSGQSGGMMAMGRQKDMAGGEMMQHQAMMEKRMDMMQMMMEQMLQHDQAMAPMPAK